MLAKLVPAPLVRTFARPYLAGVHAASALETAARLYERDGRLTTLDLLGEAVTVPEQVEKNERTYLEVVELVAGDSRFAHAPHRPSISIKPSAFTAGAREEAFVPIRRIVERARELRVAVTIDMEDHPWTDPTLEHAIRLYEEGFDVGTVLQSRLHRTGADLERIPEGMRVRLVIGIYPEPAEIALTDKKQMKLRLLDLAKRLLERGGRVELGTHDDAVVERYLAEVVPAAPERCELQILLGVPREKLLSRLAAGELGPIIPVRIYVPFATDMNEATAYLRRRLAESPNMAWLVLRNLLGD